jgi:tetratricopeptide (TPR) repeat protein
VPLFVEELTRAVLESGDAKLGGRQIPVTLHDSLMARLDRLGPAREVAQVGAVIGAEFSYELLHVVHPVAEEDLQGALRRLADAELIYVHGIAPEANYTFKHALVRDAAYEALLKSRRKELHRLVARTIDEKFPAFRETHPEVLARHWTEAGEIEPAIAEWSRAGETARARNAFNEALQSYQQALRLLALFPESPERDSRELELRQLTVWMLYVMRGYSAPETTEAIARAATLAEKSGNLTQLVFSALSRVLAPLFSGDLPAAGVFADQALELALREGSPSAIAMAYAHESNTRHWRGDLAGAEKYYTAGLKFFDDPGFRPGAGARARPDTSAPRFTASGNAPALWTFGTASYTAWLLGRADDARERMARVMAAVDVNNPHDLAVSGIAAARLQVYLREYEQAEELAVRALELSEKHRFAEAAHSRCVLGAARAELDRASDGIALIRQGIAGSLEIGARLGIPIHTTSLAAAQARAGAIIDALATVEQALQANAHALTHRPEMLRLRGELRLKQGQTELAETDFREAIVLAQKMGAKAWELRATISLARLLDSQGKRDDARAILTEIYNWFAEGFDTRDLKDAKALLDELSA